MGTFHEEQIRLMIIFCLIIFRFKNVFRQSCRENQNTHLMFNNAPPLPPKKNRAPYEVM